MVQILTQANQYSVAPPAQKASSVQRATTELLFGGVDILTDTVQDTADVVTLEQAQQEFDNVDKQILAQAESIQQDKNKKLKTVDPAKGELILLNYNKEMANLQAKNPRTAAQVRAIQTQELKTNPVLMAEMAIQKKTNDQIATMITEGTELAIANGIPNPTRTQAIEASINESQEEIALTRLERTAGIAKAVAETGVARQQANVTQKLIPFQREANNAYRAFSNLLRGNFENGKKFLESQGMNISNIKSREDLTFALKDVFIKYYGDIALNARETVYGLNTITSTKELEGQLEPFTKSLDTFIENINNPDVLKNIQDSINMSIGREQINILSDPALLHSMAILKFPGASEAFGKIEGKLLQAELQKKLQENKTSIIEEAAQSLKRGMLPSTVNQFRRGTFGGQDIQGAKQALQNVKQFYKSDNFDSKSEDSKNLAGNYVKNARDNVNNKTTVEDKSNLIEIMGEDNYLKFVKDEAEIKKNVEYTMKYLKDSIIPHMKEKLEPLKTLSSSFTDVMQFISLVPVSVASDVNPKKALNISVSKDGGVIWEIGELTQDQEENRSELEEVVKSLNNSSRWVKSAINLLATTQGIKPEEAVRQYLYDNLGVVAKINNAKPSEKQKQRTIPYQGN